MDRSSLCPPGGTAPFTPAEAEEARQFLRSLPGYAPSPLVGLAGLARELGLGEIAYKDESQRFGIGSFKALGGANAVYRLIIDHLRAEHGQQGISAHSLLGGAYSDALASLTLTCATDGNHGRAVAWAAKLFGCQCTVFVHQDVSIPRVQAIQSHGARVERVRGNYDDSVRAAAAAAADRGWVVVSDTAYPGCTDAPRYVMMGYTLIAEEALAQRSDAEPLTHVIVQAGAGALAAGLVAHFWNAVGAQRPRCVIVESAKAECYLRSAAAGKIVSVSGPLDTIMAGLACGEPSITAWDLLSLAADDFTSIGDAMVGPAMQLLARSPYGGRPLIAGESAVAGLALLLELAGSREAFRALGLDRNSRVLLIGSEGATDVASFRNLTGLGPGDISEPVHA